MLFFLCTFLYVFVIFSFFINPWLPIAVGCDSHEWFKRWQNQGSLLSLLCLVILISLSCIYFPVLLSFICIRQVIGCQDHLQNDLRCVRWGVKLYSHPRWGWGGKPHSLAVTCMKCFWELCDRNQCALQQLLYIVTINRATHLLTSYLLTPCFTSHLLVYNLCSHVRFNRFCVCVALFMSFVS